MFTVPSSSTVRRVVLALALAPACADRPAVPPGPSSPAEPSLATVAPPRPAKPATDPALGPLSLMERLGHEASHRPQVRANPERLASALAAGGLALERWKQVLGSPIGARFCMAGQTTGGTVVSVCEFAGEPEAAAGLDYSRATFDKLIPHRSLIRNQAAVLTLVASGGASENIVESKRVAEIFARL